MNKRYIEASIPKAIKLIEENSKIYNSELKQVPNEFMGYISSFAVAVTLSGPIQAIIFYGNKGSAKFHREEMLTVISTLMEVNDLMEHIQQNPLDKEKLIDSAIAFKQALNVFKLKKGMPQ